MASGSFKDTAKALNNAFVSPDIQNPLPEDLQLVVEAYLEHHQNIDEHDSQRLQDELLSIYRRHVTNTPEKHGAFVNLLRHIRPAIRGDKRLAEWWTLVIAPTINAIGHKRDEVEDAREFLLGIMVFDPEEDKDGERSDASSKFCTRLLDAYLTRTRIPTPDSDPVSPVDEFIAQELETILVTFGRRKPKELLTALDGLFIRKRYRAQTLGLLSAFVRTQPPHLHLVLETPLIDDLETCLMLDTSATAIELALTVLIMFLPHITSSLVSRLPKLMLIYTRILCFDLLNTLSCDDQPMSSMSSLNLLLHRCTEPWSRNEQPWPVLTPSFESTQSSPPLIHFFTFLYGLFPLNFTSYLRKSRKALKALNFPSADDFDVNQDIIRNRSHQYQKVHLLHPNFYTLTIEDETSESRWLKSDPADVVAECMGLCVAVSASLAHPGPPPTTKLPPLPPQAVPSGDFGSVTMVAEDEMMEFDKADNSSFSPTTTRPSQLWENRSLSRKTSSNSQGLRPLKLSASASPLLRSLDSPTLPVMVANNERRGSRKTERSSGRRSDYIPEKPAEPQLETFAQALSRTRSQTSSAEDHSSQSIASLQREVMLLRNDLNFERYLKTQHLAHVGQLQRRHLKEATVEAQTQNLLNTNRALKAKLAKADELNAQLKRETATSRNQSKKWEDSLSTKVKSYREEQKVWLMDESTLRSELQKARDDCHRLKQLIEEADSRHLRTQHQLRGLQMDLEEMERLKRDYEKIKAHGQDRQLDQNNNEEAADEREYLRTELEAARLKLSSRDHERERTQRAYEDKIEHLEARLQENAAGIPFPSPSSLSPSVQQMIDSALAGSNARLAQLKRTHSRLHDKYIELEMRCQELEVERESGHHSGNLTRSGTINSSTSDVSPKQTYHNRQSSATTTSADRGGFGRFPGVPEDRPAEGSFDFDFGNGNGNEGTQTPFGSTRQRSQNSLPRGEMPRFESARAQARWNASNSDNQSADYAGYLNKRDSMNEDRGMGGDSARSTMSWENGTANGGAVGSKLRVYGRGGAQNISKKATKDPKVEKPKSGKSGGFRGLKGIM